MPSQSSIQCVSFEKFLESTEKNLRQKASSIIGCMQDRENVSAKTVDADVKLSSDATMLDEPLVFDDFSFDDEVSPADSDPGNKSPKPETDHGSEQDLINNLNALSGKIADLWIAETSSELLFAISLLHDSPKDNFLPKREENDAAVAFMFYHGDLSNPPMVAVLDGKQLCIRVCKNHSWEDEIYSKKHEKKILLLPSKEINEDKLVLVCRFRSDITSIDEKHLDIFQSYVDFHSGRQVLFISSDPSAMLSLKENKWWNRFVENGRFHIVLCNIRNTSVGEFDSSSPIEGVLKNFKKQSESFYPGAWRHAIL